MGSMVQIYNYIIRHIIVRRYFLQITVKHVTTLLGSSIMYEFVKNKKSLQGAKLYM